MPLEEIFDDLSIVASRLLEYGISLTQTQMLVHFTVILLGILALYAAFFRFHAWIMADHGITWTWLLRGAYVAVIVGAATGTFYGWAKNEAHISDRNQMIAIVFVLLPLAIGMTLLVSANHAARSIKIERNRKRGDPLGV